MDSKEVEVDSNKRVYKEMDKLGMIYGRKWYIVNQKQ